jgi:hypothetical protein
MERLSLQKLNEAEDKEQYHVEISNRFAALESLDTVVDGNKAWETITENRYFFRHRPDRICPIHKQLYTIT